MPDETPSLGEVLHRARQAAGEQRPRPWPVEDWADRDPRLQALDEDMAAAVAAVVRERIAHLADREPLGRIAWETWTAWIAERPLHLPEDDVPWEKLGASSRELCERIGTAAAAVVRERVAVALEDYAANYPEDMFPPGGSSRDAIGGTAMRHAYRNAARIAREAPQERSDEKEAPQP